MATKKHDVKNLNLADGGRSRIDWAQQDMPVLARITERVGMPKEQKAR